MMILVVSRGTTIGEEMMRIVAMVVVEFEEIRRVPTLPRRRQ